ncbi:MAG: nucleoside monophosphate kinase, partial [Proteobacteria bacterium]|nr:nucleoside monophosphate kinase [Pseudomonadota bacterium]
PDSVVENIIAIKISSDECKEGFILDGYPRNIKQANSLDKIKKIDLVVNFEVSEEILIKRISGRFSCKNCGSIYNIYSKPTIRQGFCDKCGSINFEKRSDDSEEVTNNRLKVYRELTLPLIELYSKNNLLISIPSIKSAPLVFEELIEVVKSNSKKIFKNG